MFCKGFWQTIRNCKIFGRKAAIPISNLPPFFGSPNFAPFLESPPLVARIVAYVRPPPPPPTPLAFSPLSRNREGVYIVWTKVLHCSNIGFGLFLRFFLSNHSDLNSRYVENFYTKRWRTFSKIVTSDLY